MLAQHLPVSGESPQDLLARGVISLMLALKPHLAGSVLIAVGLVHDVTPLRGT
jgi:hypothetical protein